MNPQQPNNDSVPPAAPEPVTPPAPEPQPQQPMQAPVQDFAQQQVPPQMAQPSPFGQAPQQPVAPNPFGQPQQMVAPAPFGPAPVAQQPQQPYASPRKSNKGLLIGSIVGGVVVLAGIVVGILFATGVFSVTHEDYVKAQDALSADRVDIAKPEMSDEPTVDEILALRDKGMPSEITDYLKELDSLKAFRLDKDLKEKYSKFKDSISGMGDYLALSYESAAVSTAMYGNYSSDKTYTQQANAVIASLKDIKDKLKFQSNITYVTGLISAYTDILPAAKRMDANKNISSYSDYDSGAYTAYSVIFDKTSELAKAYKTDLENDTKYDEEAASDAFDALQDAVDQKVKESA